ncbi:hypothetical protein ACFCXT_26745 [Streptomyces vinaceus]|uniref:hypothetical protein n=1 Tax=Streptomyces vinaceus TaxID=1960 RepID=UPI0035DA2DA4
MTATDWPAFGGPSIGSFDAWFFHDADGDLDAWADSLSSRLALLEGHKPAAIILYEEPI